MFLEPDAIKVGIIGLGYVGLPLAAELSKIYPVVGFDIDSSRVRELNNAIDRTNELSTARLNDCPDLSFTDAIDDIACCNFYIVTVPTPIDNDKRPDLEPLINASKSLSKVICKGDVVVYESTVYPGATEEICLPVIEAKTKLKYNEEFFLGYSPERINPGDKVNTLTSIVKITSGSTPEVAAFIDKVYASVIEAGTFLASSIRVAEAAKVIENTQRDINIAIVNEFAKIFNLIGVDTEEVLQAARTKWNFLHFKPGLVGGHCISVDPYYLTKKAQDLGYSPEVILAGRRINDGMGQYVGTQLVKALSKNSDLKLSQSRALVLGFTFKGDCPDVRNTKIIDIVDELRSFNLKVDVYDSWASKNEVKEIYNLDLIDEPKQGTYDAIVIAVDHSEFKRWGASAIRKFGRKQHLLFDVKHVLSQTDSDIRL